MMIKKLFAMTLVSLVTLTSCAKRWHDDMYDLEEYVTQNLQHIERFLKANL